MSFGHASEICSLGAKGSLGRFFFDVGLRDRGSGLLAQIPVHRAFLDGSDCAHGVILGRNTTLGKWHRVLAPRACLRRDPCDNGYCACALVQF